MRLINWAASVFYKQLTCVCLQENIYMHKQNLIQPDFFLI